MLVEMDECDRWLKRTLPNRYQPLKVASTDQPRLAPSDPMDPDGPPEAGTRVDACTLRFSYNLIRGSELSALQPERSKLRIACELAKCCQISSVTPSFLPWTP